MLAAAFEGKSPNNFVGAISAASRFWDADALAIVNCPVLLTVAFQAVQSQCIVVCGDIYMLLVLRFGRDGL